MQIDLFIHPGDVETMSMKMVCGICDSRYKYCPREDDYYCQNCHKTASYAPITEKTEAVGYVGQ